MASRSLFLASIVIAISICNTSAEFWEDFRVKFDTDPIDHFNRMPKTELDAKKEGWEPVNFACYNDGKYLGFRYIHSELGISLIYDVMGVIAGIQMILPHSDILTPENTFRYNEIPIFNNETLGDKDNFVLTAYFVNPEIICTTGRPEEDLINIGTGEGMIWIQNGTTPENFLELPGLRPDAISNGWSINNCFPGMGSHNWYRMEDYEATNCDVQVPVFGLYNQADELLGFGFSVSGTTENEHFENPSTAALQYITGDVAPACLAESNDLIGSTTMHIYFVDSPHLIPC